MKIFLLILLLSIVESNHSYGQRVVYDYDMQLTELDSTDYRLEDQSYNFILGLSYRDIIVCKVVYHPHIDKYYVFGLIGDNNHNGNDSLKTSIVVYKGEDIAYRTETSWNGAFSFVLKKNEIARFNEEGYYTDLIINYKKR